MSSRWYSAAVVLLWLATMTWLVVGKIIPPLLVGEPPSYRSISDNPTPVAWQLLFNGRQLGWATSIVNQLENDTREIRSRVHFDHVPVKAMIPSWLHRYLPSGIRPATRLQLDTENKMTIDPLGRLVDFDTSLRLAGGQELVNLSGSVEDNRLKLTIRPGDISQDLPLPPKGLMGDALSPNAQLPGLRQDQTWTVPSYGFFHSPNNPIEILHAVVKESTRIPWAGRTEKVWLVEFRSDSGIGKDHAVRSRLWVHPDGMVLKQQIMVFDGILSFERMPDDKAAELLKTQQQRPTFVPRPDATE